MLGGVSLPTLNIQAADDASPDEDTVLQVSITPPEEGKLGPLALKLSHGEAPISTQRTGVMVTSSQKYPKIH
jgi:hypothetical protein